MSILQVVFRPEAERDLEEAFAWYESRMPGLGDEFLLCVEAAVEAARRHPTLHRIVVLAVFHGHRDVTILRQRRLSR